MYSKTMSTQNVSVSVPVRHTDVTHSEAEIETDATHSAVNFDFSEFSLSTFGGFPHLGDSEGYDRKNRGADLLVHQFLMNSLIYITRIHHQYQKLCLWQSKST